MPEFGEKDQRDEYEFVFGPQREIPQAGGLSAAERDLRESRREAAMWTAERDSLEIFEHWREYEEEPWAEEVFLKATEATPFLARDHALKMSFRNSRYADKIRARALELIEKNKP